LKFEMFLISPIWLILLGPWGALVIWLMRGRIETRGVPFLELWGRETAQNRKADRAWRMPPGWMIALLAAMLLGIVAAVGPMIRRNALTVSIPSSDVRIETLAVRAAPTTQAMIRVLNESDLTTAKLSVRAGDAVVSENVGLPVRGEMQDYFLDLPVWNSTIDAELLAGEFDHHLQASGGAAWPIVEGRGALPPEVERMIEVYGRHRVGGEGSKHIAVIAASENDIGEEPAAILMNSQSGFRGLATIEPLIVRDSSLTRFVDWDRALAGARVESPPEGDWQPLVSAAGIVVVALREEPVKQVWVGFNSDEFAHHADFVIFWSNVFDWLGDGGENYQSATAAPVTISLPAPAAGKAVSLAGEMFLGALGMMVLSALAWKAPKVTRDKSLNS
jgi:hypothetical protein